MSATIAALIGGTSRPGSPLGSLPIRLGLTISTRLLFRTMYVGRSAAHRVVGPLLARSAHVMRRASVSVRPPWVTLSRHAYRTHSAIIASQADADDRGGLVLIVERDPEVREFIAHSLGSRGFDVAVALDAVDAYKKALAERPDLILTRVATPGTPGDRLIRSLRRRAELNAVPIVVLTTAAHRDLRAQLLREGAQDFLEHPCSVEELDARVRTLVARKRADDHADRLRQQLETAHAIVTASEVFARGTHTDVRAVLERLVSNARTLTSAEYAAAVVGSEPVGSSDIWALAGVVDERTSNRDRRTLAAHRGFPAHVPAVTSVLQVPIRCGDRVLGTLYLANKRGSDAFTETDQQVVATLADRGGAAIELARLYTTLERGRAWLQQVIDQMPEGIVLMDAKGQVSLQNRAASALSSGAGKRDRFGNLVTMDLRSLSGEPVPVDDLPIVRAMVDKAHVPAQELVAQIAEGQTVPLLVTAASIQDASGESAGAMMMLQDVSPMKEVEHRREEWTSMVAHDLQQPISAIVLRTDLLLQDALTAHQRSDVRHVRSAAKRLSRMVNDLMDASQLESKRMRVHFGRVDLAQLVRDVAERTPESAPLTRVRAPVNTSLFVKGDAQRLEQVVSNLLSNALKYRSPKTRIGLAVRCNAQNAEVAITNRGPGIPPQEMPYLFDRFVRARAATTSRVKGSGLGLYIAKGLVEAHGGHIWAESVPNETTTFRFTVPLEGAPPRVSTPPKGAGGSASHTGKVPS